MEIGNYVGPFTDANAIKKSLRVLRDIFPYCACKQKHLIKCLNAHMGKYLGTCCLKNPLPEELAKELKAYKKTSEQ